MSSFCGFASEIVRSRSNTDSSATNLPNDSPTEDILRGSSLAGMRQNSISAIINDVEDSGDRLSPLRTIRKDMKAAVPSSDSGGSGGASKQGGRGKRLSMWYVQRIKST